MSDEQWEAHPTSSFGAPSPPLWGSEAVRGSGFPPQILDLDPGGLRERAARTFWPACAQPQIPLTNG